MAAAYAGDDLARSSGSRRSWRSTSIREMWQGPPDVFQRNSTRRQVVDEEEELKWAAIERLPTYDRLKKGMLQQATSTGRMVRNEVDVTNLGAQDKKQLMESILKVVEDDNEKFLHRLRSRTDRVGIEIPKIEVRFQNLSVEGDAYVGTRALPTLLNSTLNAIEGVLGMVGLSPSKKRVVKILKDVSGIIRPSRMTLLLGPPGSSNSFWLSAVYIRWLSLSSDFLAAAGRTEVVANTLGTFTLLMVFVLGGFIVAKDDIKSWMIWGYYVSPMMYGQNAIAINEFLDERWAGPAVNASESTIGKSLLKDRGLFVDEYWYWICIGALLGFSLLFNVLFIAALTYLNPLGDSKAVILEEEDQNNNKRQMASSSEGIDMAVRNVGGAHARRGMVLPFQPLSLAFNHVNYYVDMPAEMKSQGIEESRLQLLRDMFVEEVMDLVELNPLRNALVGLPGVDGLSTEQRKRLTIAVELVANPSIIFMDEPTSGLDARAAAIVMRTVRNTVDTGRTVVCTIHQPSIDIFEAFDELLLMKRGGQVIYAGPLGRHSHKLVEYFEAVPGVPKIKEGYNPATWMLEVSSTAVEAQLDVDFADIYANSSLYWKNQELIKELSTPAPGSKDLYFPTQYSQSFLVQCKACFWKQHWSYWRNSQYNAIRFFMTIIIGVLFGVIFWNKGGQIHRQQDLLNLLGATYAAVLFLGATNASAVQSVVSIERTVFYRERAAGMYSELPYAFAQVAIETIYVAIQTFVYALLLYSMIGYQWTADKFLYFYYFIFMCFTYFSMYGMMVVALTPGPQIAAIIMSFFLSFWNLFSGFLIPRPLIPVWWRWYYWCSPVAWTIYGIFASQVGDRKDKLEIPGEESMQVNEFLNKYLGFDYDFLVPIVFAHVGWVLLFFFVFAYGIRFLNFQRR
ncbi:pleiotropic drug resistance 6 [Actinidia rufa]|uniref:Pleiotropic drug resistance 6 n=1 Tax=Actinidia rufa TaxID=165716 RepID=A0A7J0GPB5_9ERIC|nr:pleiotropic drug resistance 6 [Actinidia rufa]